MHKQALKRISDELQKLKHAKDNLPEVRMLFINLLFAISFFSFTAGEEVEWVGFAESIGYIIML